MIDDDGWQVRGAVVADAGLLTGLVGDGAEAARTRTLIADPGRFIPVAAEQAHLPLLADAGPSPYTSVMTPELADYIEAGRALTPDERLQAARMLRLSVDHDAQAEQADIDAEWDEEIQRRVEELLSGTAQPVSGRESFARIRSRLDELHR